MQEISFKYNIFLTAWGWAGLVAGQEGLRILVLPEERKEDVLVKIKKELKYNNLIEEKGGWEDLIKDIKEYFTGKKVDFSNWQLDLNEYTDFQKSILQIVKKIPYGKIQTYKKVAEAANYPKAYRAVGNTMAHNPIPLIIPCHRVIGSNGKLVGFSASGGIVLKQKMLDLESEIQAK
ncbi:MAG: hypothetical protein COZ07_05180 [Candidatus Infernicultor aquiphilus]|uniref:methylated-DNA--[protein]-cysteine S-methyltransferase n=1 Tax=Candidatus Infernicultor aquiphilus TaxID=1805029 RepID=A0A1J5GQB0_9BACT|nr:methylated-DNA--[protein]-cysteine S-methyltransferase [bacterium]OIP74491.1 MAG: hypothetical protein AUK42_00965 [Candidatus Atribacteria bacterium CG2_30_33_13]PIU25839.1 MAG: hypothetical protein COT11_00595 [Candidatus Atribacteria bacterium CG08_land_8_20_14_0_20_33_29]PIW11910.1 MAG: hypothetical protein COW35_04360 [Candidatus Atribacteria bacterium CG17_big_fil_post_rev_8_21_14_2_50_34_11]PIX34050.1 MAG: hypothetical protein COZ58_05245 [Candidatus Atribacteria bacterium CG_4_8_14_3